MRAVRSYTTSPEIADGPEGRKIEESRYDRDQQNTESGEACLPQPRRDKHPPGAPHRAVNGGRLLGTESGRLIYECPPERATCGQEQGDKVMRQRLKLRARNQRP